MLDIDTAIRHCLDIADGQDKCAEISVSKHAKERISQCAADHRQLAEWLTELKELKALVAGYNPADIQTLEMLLAMMRNQNNNDTNLCELCDKEVELKESKRLLKAAVEDIYKARQGCNCNICDMPSEPTERCQYENGEDCQFKWRYADEALKLIGGSENG